MSADTQQLNGWIPRKRRTIASIARPTLSQPKFRPGPVIPIKTLVVTKGPVTLTATWHCIDDAWKMIDFNPDLYFLAGCDDYFQAQPLLEANGWAVKVHNSSMSKPVPILDLEPRTA